MTGWRHPGDGPSNDQPSNPVSSYGFNGNETHSPGTIALPIHVDPYNVITEFYVVDIESPRNKILRRSWLYIMKVVQSTYH